MLKTHRPSQSRPHSLRGKALSKRDGLQESRNIDIESDKTRSDGRSLRNFCAPPLGSSATEPIGVLEAYGARLLLCRVRAKWRRAALVLRPLWKALSLQASYGSIRRHSSSTAFIPSSSPVINASSFTHADNCPFFLGLDLLSINVKSPRSLPRPHVG